MDFKGHVFFVIHFSLSVCVGGGGVDLFWGIFLNSETEKNFSGADKISQGFSTCF